SVLNAMPREVRLDKVVEQVVAAHELTIKSERLSLRRHLERLSVLGDPEQLRVVIDNLVTNAIKFSPLEGKVEMRLRREEGEAVFDIFDEGPGIPAADAERIFDAFYQGPPVRKPFFKGSGLGLSIAQEYVNANGGSIRALESQTGAHFQVRFQLQGRDTA